MLASRFPVRPVVTSLVILALATPSHALPAARPPGRPAAALVMALAATPAPAAFALPGTAATAAPDDAADRLAYIDGLHDRRMHDLVVGEAQTFLEAHAEHPEAPHVRWRLAAALFELGRYDEARPHFARLAEQAGFDLRAAAALRLGQCELASERPAQAAAALTEARRLGDDALQEPATFLLAEARFRSGDHALALPLYDELLARWPRGEHRVDAAVARAWCLQRLGRHDETIAQCTALLQAGLEGPLADEVRFLRAESLFDQGRHEQALADARRVTSGPFADAALRGCGFAAAALGEHGQAAASFARLLTDHPDSRFVPEAAFQLGVQRLQAGDAVGAWEALSSGAVEVRAETRYWQARARGALGATEEALALLDEADRLGPDEPLAGHIAATRGDLLARAGRSAEASRAYARAGSAASLHAAAVASINAGDAEAALQLVDQVIAAGDAGAEVQLTRGEALFALGRPAEARPAFARAAESDDGDRRARARSRIAWCEYQQGRFVQAAAGFALVSREHPDAPEAEESRAMLARSLEGAGDGPAAAEAWGAYLQRHPDGPSADEARLARGRLLPPDQRVAPLLEVIDAGDDPDQVASARHALARTLVELGRAEDAAAQYQQLLAAHPGHALAANTRYDLAWLRVDAGAPDAALDVLSPLLRAPRRGEPVPPPELVTAALELAVWCHHEAGDAEAAERALDALASRDPGPERLLASARTVAAALSAAGRDERATAVLDRVGGATAAALVDSAWIALESGRVDEAEARVRDAARVDSADPAVAECAFFVGEARFAAEHDEAAVTLYQLALGADRLADQALYKQGFARLRLGDPAGARDDFDALVADHGDSPLVGESLFLAGECSFRLGEHDAAVARLEQVLAHHAGHDVAPKARFRLGLSLARLERWEDASQVLGDLARRHPDFDNLLEAELWRGRSLARLDNVRAARAAFGRVVAEDRGVLAARARLDLGRLHEAAGETEAALSEYLKVAVLYAHDDEVGEALLLAGACLERLGRRDAATARYRELLDRTPDGPHAAEARRRLGGV